MAIKRVGIYKTTEKKKDDDDDEGGSREEEEEEMCQEEMVWACDARALIGPARAGWDGARGLKKKHTS